MNGTSASKQKRPAVATGLASLQNLPRQPRTGYRFRDHQSLIIGANRMRANDIHARDRQKMQYGHHPSSATYLTHRRADSSQDADISFRTTNGSGSRLPRGCLYSFALMPWSSSVLANSFASSPEANRSTVMVFSNHIREFEGYMAPQTGNSKLAPAPTSRWRPN